MKKLLCLFLVITVSCSDDDGPSTFTERFDRVVWKSQDVLQDGNYGYYSLIHSSLSFTRPYLRPATQEWECQITPLNGIDEDTTFYSECTLIENTFNTLRYEQVFVFPDYEVPATLILTYNSNQLEFKVIQSDGTESTIYYNRDSLNFPCD
jgi:hypothetical protein